MNVLARAGRTYWRLNEIAWQHIRRAAVPIIAAVGVASVAMWFIGTRSGEPALLWAPAVYTWTLVFAWALARWLP